MTVQSAMERALALLPMKPSESGGLMDFGPMWASLAAAECLPCENAIRAAEGREELADAPKFSALRDEIPLNERILAAAFIYALASLAAKDDGDADWSSTLRARFSGSLQELTPYVAGEIADVYGGEGA